MMKNKLIYILILTMSCIGTTSAKRYYTSRERPDHLMFHLTPAVTLLDYKSADARSKIAGSVGAGMEYAHFFGRHFGLSVGAEVTSFSTFYRFRGRKDSLQMFDNWSSYYYKLRQNLTTREYQRVTYLSIPFKLQYRQLFTRKLVFNFSAGLAYTFYMGEKKSIVSGTVAREAWFDDIHVDIDEFYPLRFGKFRDYINPSSQKQFKQTLLGIAQGGFSFKLSENWNVHTELNLQYGISNIKTRSINLLVPDEYAGVTATNYIGTIRPMSVGFRIGLAYTFDLFNVDCKCHNPLF